MRSHVKRVVAIALCLITYSFARLPSLPDSDAALLLSHFNFQRLPLPEAASGHRTERPMDARLSHISGWISSVGASVALGDLDGDGLPNDVCLVDPRTDDVFVAPVPGTTDRYAKFTLSFDRRSHDSPNLREHLPRSMAPMGCRISDLDEDGIQDIIVYFWGRTPIAFLTSDRTAQASLSRSSYRATELVPIGGEWYSNALTLADVDGDGHVDIVVGNYDRDGTSKTDDGGDVSSVMQHSMSRAYNGGKNRFLLWNPPKSGSPERINFEEAATGLEPDVLNGWTLAVGAADLDGDLLPEIYFANDFGPDRLLHNHSIPGQLRFTLLNGKKDFTTPNSKVLGRDSFKGMGVDFADINADGIADIFVSNIAGPWALEESHFAFVSTGPIDRTEKNEKPPIAPFRDRSESLGLSRSGWGWDLRLADFNNDGVMELVQGTGYLKGATRRENAVDRWAELHEIAMGNDELLANPLNWPRFRADDGDDLSGHEHNPFFVLAADHRYYDIAKRMIPEMSEPYVTRGIATADCDGDGDLDFAIANQWEKSWYFRNDSGQDPRKDARNPHPSIVLDLLLPKEPHDLTETKVDEPSQISRICSPAIGARAEIRAANGVLFASQVDGGNGHSGQRSPQVHFGLENKDAFPNLTRIEIKFRWRDRSGKPCEATKPITPGNHIVLLVDESNSR